VVTQDLCAVCAVDVTTVDAAMDFLGCTGKVLTIDPNRLDDVLVSIATIGAATGRQPAADVLVGDLRRRLHVVAASVAGRPRPRVAVLEWTDPPFNAGHWVPDLVAAAGGISVLGEAGTRSATIEWSELAACRPEIIVVAPCGYHLDQASQLGADLASGGVLPAGVPVWAVDADAAFVRPGPRLVDGVESLAAVFHPEVVAKRPTFARVIGRTRGVSIDS
jgi:iron complex transport system substrate-binding protein